MGKLEEKAKQWNDLYYRILPAANKIYDQAFDEVVKLGKIEKKIKQQRIRAVELRDSAGKELSNWREKLEKLTKEHRELKDEKDKLKNQNLAKSEVPMEDMVKKMPTEELKKRIDIREKSKTFKEAAKQRDITYNEFKEAELEFLRAKDAYNVAVKSL